MAVSFSTTLFDADDRISALLVEGDEDSRHMYGEFFRRSGVELDEASDGRDALALALTHRHDAIITDTRLPGINGYDLCQLLRRDVATKNAAIIVLTAEAIASNLDRARKAGADAVLVKPCLPEVLIMEVRRLIRRSVELRRHSQELRLRSAVQVARSTELQARIGATHRRALSRSYVRQDTISPPDPPPDLVCPTCDQALLYLRSHVGGVSERHREQWDYYDCSNGCGSFQYRQRTRKLRKVS